MSKIADIAGVATTTLSLLFGAAAGACFTSGTPTGLALGAASTALSVTLGAASVANSMASAKSFNPYREMVVYGGRASKLG